LTKPPRYRVLIADDHPGIVKAVSRLLAFDHDVIGSVGDGQELLQVVPSLRPDVIVLDVNLSSLDGLKACRQITRADPRVKVVVFTAIDDAQVRRRATEAGATAFVGKNSAGGDLLAAINGLATGAGTAPRP
jgi:DNA-binding NarL/FixJ family response regulator